MNLNWALSVLWFWLGDRKNTWHKWIKKRLYIRLKQYISVSFLKYSSEWIYLKTLGHVASSNIWQEHAIATRPVYSPGTCWCRREQLLCCSRSAEQSCSLRKQACNAPEPRRQQHGEAETSHWTGTTPETWEKICTVYKLDSRTDLISNSNKVKSQSCKRPLMSVK